MCSAITPHIAGRFENLDLLLTWRVGGKIMPFLHGYLGRTAYVHIQELNMLLQNVNFLFMWQYFLLIVSLHPDPIIRPLLIT